VAEAKIIKNKDVLNPNFPAWFIRDLIVPRRKEIKFLKENFFTTKHPQNVYIFGAPGTGKTTIVCYLIDEYVRAPAENKKIIYINCKEATTKNRLLEKIAFQLATGDYYKIFKERYLRSKNWIGFIQHFVEETGCTLLLVVDEIEKTFFSSKEKRKDIALYTIISLGEYLPKGKIRSVTITNRAGLWEMCEDETRSRLTGTHLTFDVYTLDDIYKILSKRVKHSLTEKAFRSEREMEEVLFKIAKCSQENYVASAREAINILGRAALIAEERKSPITVEIVEKASKFIRIEGMARDIKSMGSDAVTLLETMVELQSSRAKNLTYWTGGISFSELMKRYEEKAVNPKTERAVRFIIEKMIQSGILSQHITYRGRMRIYVYRLNEEEIVAKALKILK